MLLRWNVARKMASRDMMTKTQHGVATSRSKGFFNAKVHLVYRKSQTISYTSMQEKYSDAMSPLELR